ncbi:MAG: hypothetical protein HKN10_04865 [Myxococcales bacterium]|nr:hypothetical protein [Myxococcales bacterium]
MKIRTSRLRGLFPWALGVLLAAIWIVGPANSESVDICAEVTCDDDNDCTEDICDPDAPWVCVFDSVLRDTPCDDGKVCDGAGACVACNDDDQCPKALDDCMKSACVAHECSGAPVVDGTPCAGGTCQTGRCALSGAFLPCTEHGIRNAIAAAGGPYTFDCQGATTIMTRAEIVIDNDVVLDGGGTLTLDGNGTHRVLSVDTGLAELRGFTISNGSATKRLDHHSCGGLMNAGVLKLEHSEVSGNTAAAGGGGGICNSGLLQVIDSAVRGNTAKACAGIFNNGALTLTDSTVSGNTAAAGGGGICSSGTLTLIRTTVSANTAAYAGGIESSGKLTVSDSALEDNVSEETGAGIFNIGEATLADSTVSGNVGADESCVMHIARISKTVSVANTSVVGCCSGRTDLLVSDGHSSESPGATCGFDQETDRAGIPADEIEEGGP